MLSYSNVYTPIQYLGEPCFVYIRSRHAGEVSFSVLDEYSRVPDFSQCGIFTMKWADFVKVFSPADPVNESD